MRLKSLVVYRRPAQGPGVGKYMAQAWKRGDSKGANMGDEHRPKINLCSVDGKLIPGSVQPSAGVDLFKVLGQQLLMRHFSIGSSMNPGKVFGRDRFPVSPLGDSALGDANLCSQLVLGADDIDSLLDSAHAPEISGAYLYSQQRRLWNGRSVSISVPNMAADPQKKAKMTAADKAAHKRLRAIWDSKPKHGRPKQEDLGLGSQSNVSQYLTGRIPLNYYAVTVFASKLGCKPEDIRDDLEEQKLLASTAQAGAEEVDRIWANYTAQEKMLAIGLHQAFLQQIKPPQEEENANKDHRPDSRRSG